ncbi:Rha family transcriptional regulator [Desulfovibrio sp. JY]|nr:Rha family transcriptional regulator [Desulfovibrio sp. JY]
MGKIEINLIDQEPRVDSRLIAKRMGVDHRSTFRLVTKFQDKLEELGIVRFEIAQTGRKGMPQKYAYLNEDQAVFLLTLTRNTPEVVALKLDLTKAFKRYRDAARCALRHAERRTLLEWQTARQEGKTARRELATVLADFVVYARAQGSAHADRYFMNITRMVYRVFFSLPPVVERQLRHTIRDHLDARQLRDLATVEERLALEMDDQMDRGVPYKVIFEQARKFVEALARMFKPSPVVPLGMASPLVASTPRPRPSRMVWLPLIERRVGNA